MAETKFERHETGMKFERHAGFIEGAEDDNDDELIAQKKRQRLNASTG